MKEGLKWERVKEKAKKFTEKVLPTKGNGQKRRLWKGVWLNIRLFYLREKSLVDIGSSYLLRLYGFKNGVGVTITVHSTKNTCTCVFLLY